MTEPRVLVTERAETPHGMDETIAVTPPGRPDLEVVVMPAVLRIGVRAVRVYLMSLLGFLGMTSAGALPTQPITPNAAFSLLLTAAGYALAPAFVSLVWNLIEILNKWDATHPELRG